MWGSKTKQLCRLWERRCSTDFLIRRSISTHRNLYSSSVLKRQDIQEGSEIEGFVVQQLEEVPEFNLLAVTLTHKTTGAEYLHLSRNDSNNTFSVGFRTTPFDSTGLPHVLEHTTLCGSVRYPCRDPFFKMLNRSLATFMNALTGPDYTMYPFATQNIRDYKNLMSVYLDAVFNPRLREIDFCQEGWRLEHEDLSNTNSRIIFKGVVFNEMKGAFSDPQSVFGQFLLNNILPSHAYGHISGGHPNKIPLLTYEDLVAFHQNYYNPNNAQFFSYGNFPLVDHLNFINQNYLSANHHVPNLKDRHVPPEPRWLVPRHKHISCRNDPLAADPKKQSTIAISVLLDDIRDLDSGFDWSVLSELLVSGPNSAFYKSLVEPQIGAGFSPSTGYESQTRDTFFSVGLQGVAQEDFNKIVNLYENTVDSVVEKGFEQQHINAVLHRIELNIKHEVSNFGLGMLFGITPLWIHGGDILKALRVNDQLASFRKRLQDNPRYLQDIVETKLKGNMHRLVLTMSPDPAYDMQQMEEENKLLEQKVSKLTEEEQKALIAQARQLQAEQTVAQDASCLPSLHTCDLSLDVPPIPLVHQTLLGVPLQCAQQPTNGLVYFRGILNVSHLTHQQKMLLPLFASVVTRMGTKSSSYRELDQRISLYTGGISFVPHLKEHLNDLSLHEEGLLFSSYSLDSNIENMFLILTEIFNELSLQDVKRFSTLVKMSAANLANGIVDRGHMYAMLSSGSLVSGSVSHKEMFSGMTFVDEMKRISQLEDLSGVLDTLKEISSRILNKNHLRCAVNYSPSVESSIFKSIESFISCIPGEVKEPSIFSAVPEIQVNHSAIHYVLPIPVNFAAKSVRTVGYIHEDSAALSILAKLLSSKYLHPLIREKGGAYGSGALLSMSGTFSFFSYRDPNSCITFDTFDGAAKWLDERKFTDGDLEEAKLGVFQKVDVPIPPGQKGMDNFLNGISDVILKEHRKRLMAVTKDDLYKVGKKYIFDIEHKQSGRALLGPVNPDLPKARKEETWIIKTPE